MDIETRFFPVFYLVSKWRFKHWTRADIERYQRKKASETVQFAIENSKYYRKHYKGKDLDDFYSLPIVNKKIMMDNLTDYNTVGLTKKDIMAFCADIEKTRDFSRRLKGLNIGMSSGTSGNKGVEITTPYEENYLRALFFARFAFLKGEKLNVCFILRVSTPAFNIDKGGHRLTYVSQLQPIERIIEQVKDIDPNILAAPPSVLRILGDARSRGDLDISPKRLVSYAEVLDKRTKGNLTKAFKCDVHEIYKCTEGAIAISCAKGRLHINEDLVLVEVRDQDGKPTPSGKPCSKMLVTDLHKRSQPMIRYELNDVITISKKPCPCGSKFRVIEDIQGRSDDIFLSTDRNGNKQYIFPDYISRTIITSSDDIEEYQAIQIGERDVRVRLMMKKGADRKTIYAIVEKNIQNVFRTYGCPEPKVTIEEKAPERNPNSSKMVRIQRKF